VAAVAEAARNVACTGARPLALTNCLNFGNPEKPEIMWEFAEATRGLSDAATALGTPVVSGNVSFYNETSGRAIHPTPTIAVVGLIEDWERHARAAFPEAGLEVVLLGETREELAGSEWLARRHGIEAGRPPQVDLEHEKKLAELLVEGVAEQAVLSAHDVSDGGLAVALAECCLVGERRFGAEIELSDAGLRPDALLFGESTGRVVTTTRDADALLARARRHGVPARRIGRTGGGRLTIHPPRTEGNLAWIDAAVSELHDAWSQAIPRRLSE
jgi:phosphoribosylformylglycinamidine synthase